MRCMFELRTQRNAAPQSKRERQLILLPQCAMTLRLHSILTWLALFLPLRECLLTVLEELLP